MTHFIIETPRLHIRPQRLEDIDVIQAAKEQAWPDLQMWMSWSHDDQLPRSALETYLRSIPAEHAWRAAAAFTRHDGALAVNGGLNDLGNGVFCTGYWCPQAVRGQGYAAEATNALIRYAFAHLKAREINIDYYEGNTASRRVVDKLGFTFSHTVKGGHHRCLDGAPLDVHYFVLRDTSALPPLEWRMLA